MSLHHSTRLYISLSWLSFIVLHSTAFYMAYFNLLDSIAYYSGSTCLYCFYNSPTSFYLNVHSCTIWLYFTLEWLYFILLDSRLPYNGPTSPYLTLHYNTMPYFTVLGSTLLYHGSASLYLTLNYSS